jgi:4,5-DOPA dioxygenase extradiol
MFALESGTTGPALRQWADDLPTPRGIVLMSPHWMALQPAVMTNPAPATWHDFGGFPEPLYQLQYPAPGDPALAAQVLDLLRAAGIEAQGDAQRPLDHGAWVPLMHMFPHASVPVVQVALPARAGPAQVYALGQALSSLAAQGVLLIGSGSITHNLAEFFDGRPELNAPPAAYVSEFSRWVESAVHRADLAALIDYRRQAPHATRAHPSEDHFLPIFFALGAARWGGADPVKAEYISREVSYRILAMDAFALSTSQGAAA